MAVRAVAVGWSSCPAAAACSSYSLARCWGAAVVGRVRKRRMSRVPWQKQAAPALAAAAVRRQCSGGRRRAATGRPAGWRSTARGVRPLLLQRRQRAALAPAPHCKGRAAVQPPSPSPSRARSLRPQCSKPSLPMRALPGQTPAGGLPTSSRRRSAAALHCPATLAAAAIPLQPKAAAARRQWEVPSLHRRATRSCGCSS